MTCVASLPLILFLYTAFYFQTKISNVCVSTITSSLQHNVVYCLDSVLHSVATNAVAALAIDQALKYISVSVSNSVSPMIKVGRAQFLRDVSASLPEW